MADPVKVRIDLASGVVEVEADASSMDMVFQHLNEFLPRLSDAYGSPESHVPPDPREAVPEERVAEETERRKQPSRGAGARKETYRLVDLGLSAEEREALRKFYEAKAPKGQNEQVAVLLDWLKREKSLTLVDRDGVFTAFRTVEAKVPGKISSVLGNMSGLGWIVLRGDGKYEITHVAEDHVRLNLPAKKAAR